MKTYVELVRRRLEDRANNIVGNLDKFLDPQLRFTMRIFGDCLDEETRGKMLSGYSEHLTEQELRAFAADFVPAYTAYAIAELEEKKQGGERHEPPFLTQEEYQEMAVREKWPRIAERMDEVKPLQLRREIARAAMLFRPYMLSDAGFNEGVLEFSLYFDLLQRLRSVSERRLREAAGEIAPRIATAVAATSEKESEALLREIRTAAATAAGLPADPETLLGPPMEKYPREVPPEYRLREMKNTLATMTLKDLRLTALVHLDLLTVEETRRIVLPFLAKFPSFYEMPSKGLRELILAVVAGVDGRSITYFIERYGSGWMAMTKPVDYIVWKLMPEEERVAALRRDNERMDAAMMARHLARFLHSESEQDLSDAGKQIALLTDARFVADHGAILTRLGAEGEGERIK
ncbi:MAG TPA: hypothetical protein VN450_03770, partial [Candidatus Methylomirabilis sp.]|nr:hypothetical protein [Candidatus Methylomirabilis sp.]